jgi:uncharacterized protein (DUF885 family)
MRVSLLPVPLAAQTSAASAAASAQAKADAELAAFFDVFDKAQLARSSQGQSYRGIRTAYSEGWGLYTEKLAKEMGQYQNPYNDFGRLQLELHRAIRLVVDTGIHDKRWSREDAIAYLKANSADPEGGIQKAIERYTVYPGQATAYMVGRLKILELRERARQALGPKFDIRQFHNVVLSTGAVPLDILEENVDTWIADMKRN